MIQLLSARFICISLKFNPRVNTFECAARLIKASERSVSSPKLVVHGFEDPSPGVDQMVTYTQWGPLQASLLVQRELVPLCSLFGNVDG